MYKLSKLEVINIVRCYVNKNHCKNYCTWTWGNFIITSPAGPCYYY